MSAADLPAPWVDQLADDGRLLVPLRFRSLSRTIAFTPESDHLRSDALIRSGFVAMQGVSAHAPRTVQLARSDVRLVVDEDQAVDDTALTKAFAEPRCEQWTGVELTGSERVLPRLDVWLAGAVAPSSAWTPPPCSLKPVHGLAGHILWLTESGFGVRDPARPLLRSRGPEVYVRHAQR